MCIDCLKRCEAEMIGWPSRNDLFSTFGGVLRQITGHQIVVCDENDRRSHEWGLIQREVMPQFGH